MDADYTAAYAELYRHHWWWRVREQILVGKIQQLLAHRDRDGEFRILDIGCGAGLFFDALQRFGSVEGIESDATAVAQSGRWRERIHLGHVETFVSRETFDVILLLDVLEHVDAPEILLRHALRFLAPTGRVLITVPAFASLWTSHDDLNHHRRRYTASSVRRLIQDAGLTSGETQYLFQSLTVPKLFVRAKETLISSRPELPRVPPHFINRLLEFWLRFENSCAGRLPFGTSVIAVARRPDV